MPEKKEKNPEALGISGFTLGITSLVMAIFIPLIGAIEGAVGLTFCYLQQKKKKTTKGKIGIILNIIGIILNAVVWYVVVKYVYPLIQSTGFPAK